MIWNFAVPRNNNVLIVAYLGNHDGGRCCFKSPNKPSPLLVVCKTSRLVALSHYNASIGSRGSKRKLRFDAVYDKVLLQVEGTIQFIDLLVDSVAEERGFGAIQNLIVKEGFAQQIHWKADLTALFRAFRGLRTVGMAVPGNSGIGKETAREEDEGRAFAVIKPWARVRSGLMNTPGRQESFKELKEALREVYPFASTPILELVRVWLVEKEFGVKVENTGVGVSVGEAGDEGVLPDEIVENMSDYELLYGLREEDDEPKAGKMKKRSKSF